MLEIIIMIAVVRMFAAKAKEKKFNNILWGFIGAASFYGPVLIMSFWVLPELVYAGIIPLNSEAQIKWTFIGYSVLTGALCCVIAYQILKRMKALDDDMKNELLDNQQL